MAGATATVVFGFTLIIGATPVTIQGDPDSLKLEKVFINVFFALGVCSGATLFIFYGKMIDKRIVVLSSLISYCVVSSWGCFAETFLYLYFIRFLQGVAASSLLILVPVITYSVSPKGKVIAFITVLTVIETVVPSTGPALGYFIAANLGWQFNFFLISLVGLFIIIIGFFVRIPDQFFENRRQHTQGVIKDIWSSINFRRHAVSQVCSGISVLTVTGVVGLLIEEGKFDIDEYITFQVLGLVAFSLSAGFCVYFKKFAGYLKWKTVSGLTALDIEKIENYKEFLAKERFVLCGTILVFSGSCFFYVALSQEYLSASHLIASFVIMNLGLGMRGPSGLVSSIDAIRFGRVKAVALIILGLFFGSLIMMIAISFLAEAYPWLFGLVGLVFSIFSLIIVWKQPRLRTY